MLTNLLPLLVLLLIAWIWLAGARAREFATALVRQYCQTRGLQFLDDTVSLARMGLRRTSDGLQMRRMFRFEFSLEGMGRRIGYIILIGTRLELIDDGLPKPSYTTPEPPVRDVPTETHESDRKVVPFRRK